MKSTNPQTARESWKLEHHMIRFKRRIEKMFPRKLMMDAWAEGAKFWKDKLENQQQEKK